MPSQDASIWTEHLPTLEHLIDFAQKILLAILVFAVGRLLIHLMKRHVSRWRLLRNTKTIDERSGRTMTTLMDSLLQYVVHFLVICQILAIFGVSVSSILAVAGIGSIAIGFGAQSIVKDVFTGIFILAEDNFAVGDTITVGEQTGIVEAMGIRATRVRGFGGELYIIPNGEISIVTNLSKGSLRALVVVPIPYEADIDRVIAILSDEMASFQGDGILSAPVVQGISELGEDSVKLRVACECKAGENWGIERELRRLIKKRLDAEGIPHPQRVVRVVSEHDVPPADV